MTGPHDQWPAWIPPEDTEGHRLGPERVNFTWRQCDCRRPGGGHNVVRCRVNGCKAPPIFPPEHRD